MAAAVRRLLPPPLPLTLVAAAHAPSLVGRRSFARAAAPLRQQQQPRAFSDFPLEQQLLKRIPHAACTEIQALTLQDIRSGRDVLAQAKTGEGKTAAFLIPLLDQLLRSRRPSGGVSALIVAPSRELAAQIAREATALAPSNLKVVTVYGNTNIKKDVCNLQQGCDILVGTPGRLNDLLDNYGLKSRLQAVQHLILDECDRLLDQGFMKSVLKIIASLPERSVSPRQTLLFSATLPPAVQTVLRSALLPGFAHRSSLKPQDANTHERVPQQVTIVPWADIYAAALTEIQLEFNDKPAAAKIMVFAPTARGAEVLGRALQKAGYPQALTIHSRLSQAKREKAAAAFQACQSGILVSSDVTARGMDFKDVTLVVQVGVAMSPEQYIHRLGRTARAGKSGRGVLILTPDESSFMQKEAMAKLPIERVEPLEIIAAARETLRTALRHLDEKDMNRAAIAHLGFYKGVVKPPRAAIALSTEYAKDTLGLAKFPPMPKLMIGRMGLKNMGLEVDESA